MADLGKAGWTFERIRRRNRRSTGGNRTDAHDATRQEKRDRGQQRDADHARGAEVAVRAHGVWRHRQTEGKAEEHDQDDQDDDGDP